MELFKIIQKMERNYNTPDLHSCTAKAKKCSVFVEVHFPGEILISESYYNGEYKQFCGNVMQITNRLEMLGIDINTIEM